eukprot:CAMPEP_0175044356 /NCGR_PEP_ID=MMETSP0052_2-20121109/3754_1 /TAXON_ID=51329 ORGANISM="Polytomella parva, Strain SAG 63-3" /NCGR_SAMPLE_ID=MMETSP0052_2 /ASSEMBLY_ACC=CAM_ASM_000194 /LENGTH=626 /DNA_ID=CAMNT_0016307631 /DNA_START=159 /DNA_END=2036 /DNA_ORIENTATION=-
MAIIDSICLISKNLRLSTILLIVCTISISALFPMLKMAHLMAFNSFSETLVSAEAQGDWIKYNFSWSAIPRKGDPGICIAAQLDPINELYIRSSSVESKLFNKHKVRRLDVVLTHYKEAFPVVRRTISVLSSIPSIKNREPLYFIISKSPPYTDYKIFESLPEADVILRQANVGREGVAYLVYLIKMYDYLPNHVLFLQARPNKMMRAVIPRLHLLFGSNDRLGVLGLANINSDCELEGPCDFGPTSGSIDMWRVFRGGNSDPEDLGSRSSIDAAGAKLFTIGSALGDRDASINNNNTDNNNNKGKSSLEYRRSMKSRQSQDPSDRNRALVDSTLSSHSFLKVNAHMSSSPLSSPSSSLKWVIPPPPSTWTMQNGQFLVSRKRILQNSVEKYKWALGFVLGASGGHKASYVVPESLLKNKSSSHLYLNSFKEKGNTSVAEGAIVTVASANGSQSIAYDAGNDHNNDANSNHLSYKLRPIVSNPESLNANTNIKGMKSSYARLNPGSDPGPTFWEIEAYYAENMPKYLDTGFRNETLTSCDAPLSLYVLERAWSYMFNCYENPYDSRARPGNPIFFQENKEGSGITDNEDDGNEVRNDSNEFRNYANQKLRRDEVRHQYQHTCDPFW